jgi:hypothetical protein
MNKISRAFKYLAYYREANTPELHQEARESARVYYNERPELRTTTNVSAYKRGFINARCRLIAKERLNSLDK